MKLDNQPPHLLAGLFRDVAWIRVRGRGTFQTSPQLRAFADQLIEDGPAFLAVDLEDCIGMDSTFLGTLTGIALRFRAHPGARLQILNASSRNLQSLETLGLDQILEVDQDGTAWAEERRLVQENVTQPLEPVTSDPASQRQIVTEAHEALCEANAANVNRFRDVLDYLRNQPARS